MQSYNFIFELPRKREKNLKPDSLNEHFVKLQYDLNYVSLARDSGYMAFFTFKEHIFAPSPFTFLAGMPINTRLFGDMMKGEGIQ